MSESTAAVTTAEPEQVSKRRRVVRIASWIVGLVVLLALLRPGGRRRLGLAHRALGHGHGDLVRLHHPRLPLPGPADGPDRSRLVRDPALRISRRRDVHARARVLCGRGRAEQLPAGEHRHVRDAADVRRGRAGRDVPRRPRRLHRSEDLLLRDRDADLRLPVLAVAGSFDFQFGNERDAISSHSVLTLGIIGGGDLPDRAPAADLLGLGQEDVGEGEAGRRDPRRPPRVREARAAAADGRLRREGAW